jgi:hypothetical protein
MSGISKVVLVCVAVAVTGVFASLGAAADSARVSGTWSVTPQSPTGFKQAGVNLKLSGVSLSTWSGELVGTTSAQATFVIHPDGSIVSAPIRETFTGTVTGHGTGTLDFVEEAHAQPDGSTEIAATIIGGSGALTNLHGRLIFTGTCDIYGACAGTYSGELHG